jgi:hypothetical protein
LPLSAAVFETESGITLRLSSVADGFSPDGLREIADRYFSLLHGLIESDPQQTVGSLLQQMTLPIPNH